jgi:hypothetical protein
VTRALFQVSEELDVVNGERERERERKRKRGRI